MNSASGGRGFVREKDRASTGRSGSRKSRGERERRREGGEGGGAEVEWRGGV